jgi:hypothetical protein
MALRLSDLTSAAAVQAALDEYERLGKEAFLRKHGFREASGFLVRNPRTQGLADSRPSPAWRWPVSTRRAVASGPRSFQAGRPHSSRCWRGWVLKSLTKRPLPIQTAL